MKRPLWLRKKAATWAIRSLASICHLVLVLVADITTQSGYFFTAPEPHVRILIRVHC